MLGKWQVKIDGADIDYELETKLTRLALRDENTLFTYDYWLTLAVF